MVTQAQEQDLEQAKQLWKLCFGDSDQYVDFYFSSRYKKEYTYCINDNDCMVSSAQFFPYKLSYYNELLSAVYILGVCTHPLHRKMGHAGRILIRGLCEGQQNGMALAALIPQEESLFEFYRRYGFSEIFDVETELLRGEVYKSPPSLSSLLYEDTPAAFESLYRFYDQWYRGRQIALIKSRDDFRFAVEDLIATGCQIFICGSPDNVQGFAAAYFGEQCAVKEILFYNEEVRYSLLHSIFLNGRTANAHVIYPAGPDALYGVRKPLGMARVLNPAVLLSVWADQNQNAPDISIKIYDPLLSVNSGSYHIRSGKVSFSPHCEAPCDIELDIYGFTRLILGYQVPEKFRHVFRCFSAYANLLMN